MSAKRKDIDELRESLRQFAKDRNWEQFHSPKNLSMALSGEVAEIIEIFQWLTQEQSRNLDGDKLAELKDEIGDVMIYLTMLADKFDIDPLSAAADKMKLNIKKYPADTVRGKSDKYTKY